MKSKKSLNPQENRRVQRFYFYMTVKDRIITYALQNDNGDNPSGKPVNLSPMGCLMDYPKNCFLAQSASLKMARPTPMASAIPATRSASAWEISVTPPVRITGILSTFSNASVSSPNYPGSL